MAERQFRYDVAISYAGEDKAFADALFACLSGKGIATFYANAVGSELWGKDLYQHFQAVFRDQAQYCVILISKAYVSKVWTQHELRQAQARALLQSSEYILPVRLDDSEVPGLNDTVAYFDGRQRTPTEVCAAVVDKLRSPASSGQNGAVSSTPVDDPENEPELLDLRVDLDDSFAAAMKALTAVNSIRGVLTVEDAMEWTERSNALLNSGKASPRKALELVNERAKAFSLEARQLAPLAAEYRRQTERFFDALEKLTDYQIGRGLSRLEDLIPGLESFLNVDRIVKGARASQASVATTASALPAPTRDFKKARNSVVKAKRELVAAIDYWLERSDALRIKYALGSVRPS